MVKGFFGMMRVVLGLGFLWLRLFRWSLGVLVFKVIVLILLWLLWEEKVEFEVFFI